MSGRRRRALVAPVLAVLLVSGCSVGSGEASTRTTSSVTGTPDPQPLPAPPSPSPRDADGCRYVRTRLPAPPGPTSVTPEGGDGHGLIVGTATGRKSRVAVLWRDGRVTTLAMPGGRSGSAIDVNRSGVVLGQVSNPDRRRFGQGYLWRDGRAVRLGGRGRPAAINDAGLVVGTARIGGSRRIVYWKVSDPGRRHVIGGTVAELPGDLSAHSLDDTGQIAGVGHTSTGRHAITGTVDGIRPVPGIPIALGWSEAIDVRGRQLIGHGSYPGHPATTPAVSWRRDGDRYIELPAGITAWRVNARGVVAGTADVGGLPVVVDPTNRVVDLPLPPGSWSAYVSAVLDDGSVVGGADPGGDGRDTYQALVWQRRC